MPLVQSIHTYPLKSAGPINHQQVIARDQGLSYDRRWALVDNNGNCLTARTHPSILHLHPRIENDRLILTYKNRKIGAVSLQTDSQVQEVEFKIFSYDAFGSVIEDEPLTQSISNLIGVRCRIMATSKLKKRPVLEKHGGQENDTIAFADQAPILLVSEASLEDLNTRTSSKIQMQQFRPNIVISETQVGEEDTWKRIQIGEKVVLRLIQQCERCIFTTIDPVTLKKHPRGEPLRTLSKYRLNGRKNTVFGMHAVVDQSGLIKKGSQIRILE